MKNEFLSFNLIIIFFLIIFNSNKDLFGQDKIYNFQEVDILPTFEDCPTSDQTEIEDWINCFYPKIEKLVTDSIKSMEREVEWSSS